MSLGIIAGLVGASLVGRIMESFLYEVEPFDPVTFVVVPAVLGAVAFAATYVPARRAGRIDPVVALNGD